MGSARYGGGVVILELEKLGINFQHQSCVILTNYVLEPWVIYLKMGIHAFQSCKTLIHSTGQALNPLLDLL